MIWEGRWFDDGGRNMRVVVSIGILKSGVGDIDPGDPSGLLTILLRTVHILYGVLIIPFVPFTPLCCLLPCLLRAVHIIDLGLLATLLYRVP